MLVCRLKLISAPRLQHAIMRFDSAIGGAIVREASGRCFKFSLYPKFT